MLLLRNLKISMKSRFLEGKNTKRTMKNITKPSLKLIIRPIHLQSALIRQNLPKTNSNRFTMRDIAKSARIHRMSKSSFYLCENVYRSLELRATSSIIVICMGNSITHRLWPTIKPSTECPYIMSIGLRNTMFCAIIKRITVNSPRHNPFQNFRRIDSKI